MTRERLEALKGLCDEALDLKGRIRALESRIEGRSAPMSFGLGGKGPQRGKIDELGPRLADLRDRHATALDRAMAEYEAVAMWIASVECPQLRCIFRKRYLDGLPWTAIALKLGGGTADSVRMTVKRYMDRLEKGRGTG